MTTDTKTAERVEQTIVQPEPKAQLPEVRAPLRGGGAITPIIPQDIEQAWRLAGMIAASGTAPKSYRGAPNNTGPIQQNMVCVAIMAGLEVGLPPMQAIQGIAVINGMPTVYGDARDGLVAASGLLVDMKEEMEKDADGLFNWTRCTIWRKDRKTPIVQEITRPQAARAGWLKKQGPWTDSPNRMAQMRAKGWASRDAFPDVLKGLIDYDEAMDMVDITAQGAATTAEPQRADYVEQRQETQQTAGANANSRSTDDRQVAEDPEGWPFYDETGEEVDKYTAKGWLKALDVVIGPLAEAERAVAIENNRDTALMIAKECVAEIGEEVAAMLVEHFTPATDVAAEAIEEKAKPEQKQEAAKPATETSIGLMTQPTDDMLVPTVVGQENVARAMAKLIGEALTPETVQRILKLNQQRMSAWAAANRRLVSMAADDKLEDLQQGSH